MASLCLYFHPARNQPITNRLPHSRTTHCFFGLWPRTFECFEIKRTSTDDKMSIVNEKSK